MDDTAAAQRREALSDLLARTARADERAFAELYRLTSPHLFAVAIRMLRDRAAAEDVLQEAFVSIWHHAGSYVPVKSHPQTWLTSIVRNRCLDLLRRRVPDTMTLTRDDDEGDIDLPAGGPTPVELLLSGANAAAVRGCVDALDGGPKQAIALAFFQGLSHSELAARLHEPLGTVKSWIRRGLERLKACLERSGIADAGAP
jgi:RNA polymerase sigma-70 factor (ECF subfamily)